MENNTHLSIYSITQSLTLPSLAAHPLLHHFSATATEASNTPLTLPTAIYGPNITTRDETKLPSPHSPFGQSLLFTPSNTRQPPGPNPTVHPHGRDIKQHIHRPIPIQKMLQPPLHRADHTPSQPPLHRHHRQRDAPEPILQRGFHAPVVLPGDVLEELMLERAEADEGAGAVQGTAVVVEGDGDGGAGHGVGVGVWWWWERGVGGGGGC